jgi:hypothetical protein
MKVVDNTKNPHLNFDMWAIVIDLPDGLNYFEGIAQITDKDVKEAAANDIKLIEGVFNSWDTDRNFAKRFRTEHAAKNFMNTVIKTAEAYVINLKHVL